MHLITCIKSIIDYLDEHEAADWLQWLAEDTTVLDDVELKAVADGCNQGEVFPEMDRLMEVADATQDMHVYSSAVILHAQLHPNEGSTDHVLVSATGKGRELLAHELEEAAKVLRGSIFWYNVSEHEDGTRSVIAAEHVDKPWC